MPTMARTKVDRGYELAQAFGKTVKAFREKAKKTQDDLAYEARIDRSYMSQIERGIRNVTLPIVWQLAKALGVRPSRLISSTEKKLR